MKRVYSLRPQSQGLCSEQTSTTMSVTMMTTTSRQSSQRDNGEPTRLTAKFCASRRQAPCRAERPDPWADEYKYYERATQVAQGPTSPPLREGKRERTGLDPQSGSVPKTRKRLVGWATTSICSRTMHQRPSPYVCQHRIQIPSSSEPMIQCEASSCRCALLPHPPILDIIDERRLVRHITRNSRTFLTIVFRVNSAMAVPTVIQSPPRTIATTRCEVCWFLQPRHPTQRRQIARSDAVFNL